MRACAGVVRWIRDVALFVALPLACGVSAAPAEASIYWAQGGSFIGRAASDGSGALTLVMDAQTPRGVALDATYVYWVNAGSLAIGRAKLDGSAVDEQFITFPSSMFGPFGIAVDAAHIFWSNFNGNVGSTISRADLDGSGVVADFIPTDGGAEGLAVDGAHLYWPNLHAGSIGRATVDGGSVDQSFIPGASSPLAVTVDGAHVYWTNFGSHAVGRANLDGSGVEQTFITGIADASFGIAVDAGHVYWVDNGNIARANLDGTGVEESFVPASAFGVAVQAVESCKIAFGPYVEVDDGVEYDWDDVTLAKAAGDGFAPPGHGYPSGAT